MHLSLSLLLAISLAALAHTRSVARSPDGQAQSDLVRGPPASGVSCETDKDERHVISHDLITAVVAQAMSNLEIISEDATWKFPWPKKFSLDQIGFDPNKNKYTVITPPFDKSHCDLSQPGLFYIPIPPSLDDVSQFYGFQELPLGETSPDIAVFQTPDATTAFSIGQYCGVLTNTDSYAHGYRQCNNAESPGW